MLEIVATDPWGTHNGFDTYALFELMYSIIAAHVTVEANVRDLQVCCLHWATPWPEVTEGPSPAPSVVVQCGADLQMFVRL